MLRRRFFGLAALCLVIGCSPDGLLASLGDSEFPSGVGGPGTGQAGRKTAEVSQEMGQVLGLDGRPAANVLVRTLIANNSGALISDNGAGLISDNGAGLITDNGAGLIGNNGAKYRTMATEVRTDAEGRFKLAIPAGAVATVEAIHSDNVKALRTNIAASATGVTLQLAPTGAITGRVTAPSNPQVTNLEGIDVYIPGTSYVAKTNRQGRFTLTNVPEGVFSLSAGKNALGRVSRSGIQVAANRMTELAELPLVLTAPQLSSISGTLKPGTEVTLKGKNLGAAQGDPYQVYLNGLLLIEHQRVDDETLKVKLPANATTGQLVVLVDQVMSNPLLYIVPSDTPQPVAGTEPLPTPTPAYTPRPAEGTEVSYFFPVAGLRLVLGRHFHMGVRLQDYYYVLGGEKEAYVDEYTYPRLSVDSVERATIRPDGTLGTFETLPQVTLTTPRNAARTFVAGQYLYVMGGIGGRPQHERLASIERAEIRSDGSLGAFQPVSTTLKEARCGFALAVAKDYVYVIGGLGAGETAPGVERAHILPNGDLGEFETLSVSLRTKRWGGATVIGDYLYLVSTWGTVEGAKVERARIQADGSLGAFEVLEGLSLGDGKTGAGIVQVGGYLYLVGGGEDWQVWRSRILPGDELGPFEVRPELGYVQGAGDHTTLGVGDYLYNIGGGFDKEDPIGVERVRLPQ